MSTLLTVGGSTSGGSRLRAPLTTRSTSTETRSGLAAVVNWTMTVETPCDEIEVRPFVSMFGRRGDRVLDRLGDVRLDRLGVGARVDRRDDDRREVHVRA